MGKLLGAHESDEELDRPDLNKCPDCGCFFAQDHCPLCGKECPEEMRAGNRKRVKHKKHRSGGSSRVRFVPLYHEWWFILLMMAFMPVVGIVLLISSPHKRSHKIAVVAIAAAYTVLISWGVGYRLYDYLMDRADPPINESLDREAYQALCEPIEPEDFYRSPAAYAGKYVVMTLKIERAFTDMEAYYNSTPYPHYYLCTDEAGTPFVLLLRDCFQNQGMNLIASDTAYIWGQGAGMQVVYDNTGTMIEAPCLNGAYAELTAAE